MKPQNRMTTYLYILALVSIAFSSLIFFTVPEPQEKGEHWHVRLNIIINGQEIPIPAGVGMPDELHQTYDWDNIIHVDPSPENRKLGTFFDIWGVRFSKTCIFQYCNADIVMVVNGEENSELNEYVLQDRDGILLVVKTF